MANDRLILRSLISPWVTPIQDLTKSSVLTHDEVDNNFIYLRGELIYTAQTVGSTVTLKKINGNDLSFNVGSGGGSGSTGGYWTTGGTDNTALRSVFGNNTINGDSTSSVIAGEANTIGAGPSDGTDGSYIFSNGSSIISGGTGAIFGGRFNLLSNSPNSFIGGGNENIISGNSALSVIVGCLSNTVDDTDKSFIGGGEDNTLNGERSIILGGLQNTITGHTNSAIIGGTGNTIDFCIGGWTGVTNPNSEFIIGGNDNTVYNSIGTGIIGSFNSTSSASTNSVMMATSGSTMNNRRSVLLGGAGNVIGISKNTMQQITSYGFPFASDLGYGQSSIIGGINNTNDGWASSILGGVNNEIGAECAVGVSSIIGGASNFIFSMDHSSIIGGEDNNIIYSGAGSNETSTIIGSSGSSINNSSFSAIIGGKINKISGLNGVVVIGGTGITAATEDTVYVPKLNVGTGTPDSKLHVGGTYGELKVRLDNENSNSTNQLFLTSDENTYTNFVSIGTPTSSAELQFGMIGPSSTSRVVGNPDDSFIAATSAADNMNFINNEGSGTSDNIGFYAGKVVLTHLSATTSDIMILGDGTNRGYVGIGTDTPTEKLDVVSNLKVRGQAYTPIHDNLTGGTTFIPDWDNSNVQILTLSGNTNVSGGTSTMKGGSTYTMLVKQSNGGSHTITYDSTYKWEEGNPPTLSTADGSVDIITFICDGTSLYGLIAKNFQ